MKRLHLELLSRGHIKLFRELSHSKTCITITDLPDTCFIHFYENPRLFSVGTGEI